MSLGLTKLQRAGIRAVQAHRGQRYGNEPYSAHLLQVVQLLGEFFPEASDLTNLLCAGYFHDALEDTALTEAEIAVEFGPEVAAMVVACTGIGPNRKARNADIAAKLQACPSAARVKLADRAANVANCRLHADPRIRMYQKEHPEFRAMLLRVDPTLTDHPLLRRVDEMVAP